MEGHADNLTTGDGEEIKFARWRGSDGHDLADDTWPVVRSSRSRRSGRMSDVFLVVLDKVHEHPVVSAHATEAKARSAVEAILDDMPERGGLTTTWVEKRERKRKGPHVGYLVAAWACRSFGPSTNHISEIYILRLEVSNVFERLADLVQEES